MFLRPNPLISSIYFELLPLFPFTNAQASANNYADYFQLNYIIRFKFVFVLCFLSLFGVVGLFCFFLLKLIDFLAALPLTLSCYYHCCCCRRRFFTTSHRRRRNPTPRPHGLSQSAVAPRPRSIRIEACTCGYLWDSQPLRCVCGDGTS